MTPTPRSAPSGARSTSAPSLPSGRAAAGSPPRFCRPRRRGLPLCLSPHQRPSTGRRPPRTLRGGRRIRSLVSIDRVSVLRRWVRGGAARAAASPPGQRPGGGREGPVRGRPRAGSVVGPRRVFDNPVVGHASISNSRVCVVVARINLSTNARGDVGPPCRGRGRVDPQSRNGRPARVARRRGPRHRREVCIASGRSAPATGALGLRVGEAVGSAWSSPQGHGVDA